MYVTVPDNWTGVWLLVPHPTQSPRTTEKNMRERRFDIWTFLQMKYVEWSGTTADNPQ